MAQLAISPQPLPPMDIHLLRNTEEEYMRRHSNARNVSLCEMQEFTRGRDFAITMFTYYTFKKWTAAQKRRYKDDNRLPTMEEELNDMLAHLGLAYEKRHSEPDNATRACSAAKAVCRTLTGFFGHSSPTTALEAIRLRRAMEHLIGDEMEETETRSDRDDTDCDTAPEDTSDSSWETTEESNDETSECKPKPQPQPQTQYKTRTQTCQTRAGILVLLDDESERSDPRARFASKLPDISSGGFLVLTDIPRRTNNDTYRQ
ncbi:hypothetical protein F5Y15DRAFT_412229 [Xylariaceae sp. FL0016]|nr:hypothetical protein F5Y15DRAFT_412229 [Xylariaceae sp. FL0016]